MGFEISAMDQKPEIYVMGPTNSESDILHFGKGTSKMNSYEVSTSFTPPKNWVLNSTQAIQRICLRFGYTFGAIQLYSSIIPCFSFVHSYTASCNNKITIFYLDITTHKRRAIYNADL